jgi:3alpha(or 20beta)-hydroxysteroid dehydrogenase
LVAAGARVLIGDICDEGRDVASDLGERCRYVRLDVTKEEGWMEALAAAKQWGGLHGLVNNAAVYIPKRLADTSSQEFELHMQVNQLGSFLGMKLASPLMAESGGGSIVNVSSTAGLRGSARAIAYCATKWALRGMTKAAAVDLARFGIRVNSFHPGPIETGMLAGSTAAQRAQRISMVPLEREGTVDEVAELVSFLLSERSSYITGAEIAIDGGLTL